MNTYRKILFWRLMILVCLFILLGCANNPKTLDPSISGPQAIVNPETICLGVVKMRDTNIVFEGSGFQAKAGDSVLITLTGPNATNVTAAEAPIQQNGTFKAAVPPSP